MAELRSDVELFFVANELMNSSARKTSESKQRPTILVWFRLDLRLADNPAIQAAINSGGNVVPIFIWAPEEEAPWEPGAASRWWLHQSLNSLSKNLKKTGSRLIIRHGPTLETLRAVVQETEATNVFWNRRYEPVVIRRDANIKENLKKFGVHGESFNAALLREPWEIQNTSRKPFKVFTPFWRHCLGMPEPPQPLPAPLRLRAPQRWPESISIEALQLEPKIDWAKAMREAWRPGEQSAMGNLGFFLENAFADYSKDRNYPDIRGTSRLSPHLHFGEISARQIWHGVKKFGAKHGVANWRNSQYIAELGWREFAYHLLFHFPNTPQEPLRNEFAKFNWRKNPAWLEAWQKGRTGYPMVDAGMRELWATGWMHNRLRMIVASFLTKDLLQPWLDGARWFWDTLVDADLAQNTLGWQWTAGCGADAAPFFRIFNPVTQGEKFDPSGNYIRRWCPELAKLSAPWIHEPWAAQSNQLMKSGPNLQVAYPERIVIHSIARAVALDAYSELSSSSN